MFVILNRNKFVKQTCSQAEYKDVLSNSGTDAAGSMQKRVCDKQTRRPRIDKDVNSWTALGIEAVSFLPFIDKAKRYKRIARRHSFSAL